MGCKDLAPCMRRILISEIGLDGFHARSKPYAAVLHRACVVFSKSCPNL